MSMVWLRSIIGYGMSRRISREIRGDEDERHREIKQ